MPSLDGFDANQVEPTSFEPIPAGKYLAAITDSEKKKTKSGDGEYLQLTFKVLEPGPYKGRLLWARLNLKNSNATAVKIARGELSAICRAVGVMKPRDSVDLHNIPLVISVKCKKRKDTDDLTNEIKGYEARNKTATVAAPTTSAPAPVAAAPVAATTAAVGATPGAVPTTNTTPPWKR